MIGKLTAGAVHRLGCISLAAAVSALTASIAVQAQPTPAVTATVTSFTPLGDIKKVRQVTARFSQPMVNFGDPRAEAPFEINCSVAGRGRWSDSSVWLYDFENDLPGGTRCSFSTKAGLKTAAGDAVASASFEFNTGGPAVLTSAPHEGWGQIDEAQVFLLALDAQPDLATVRARAFCSVAGVGEKIGVVVLEGKEREDVIAAALPRSYQLFQVLFKSGQRGRLGIKDPHFKNTPLVALRCARPAPPNSVLSLVWDAGIATIEAPSRPAVPTRTAQTLTFRVRPVFSARQTCERVNPNAGCIPVLPVMLVFSAPVHLQAARQIELRTGDGRIVHPDLPHVGRGFAVTDETTVDQVSFPGPFAERTEVRIHVPRKFADDAGRPLANAADFPLRVRIDEDPPLIKFPSTFGILEAQAEPVMPVSVRNVEATLTGAHVELTANATSTPMPPGNGAALRINTSSDEELARWLRRLMLGPDRGTWPDLPREGERPLLSAEERAAAQPLHLPLVQGERPLQLLGIPLPAKGLHVVEFESRRLGAALHGQDRPYYVYSSALVTNLAVHFKHGRESSMAWVTRLDNARPVPGARVRVSDCAGQPRWQGATDQNGIARIDQELPTYHRWKDCQHAPQAYLVTARTDDDMSFLLTSWSQGIETWQFNLMGGAVEGPVVATTVTDRALFRAGETVSMKHFIRRRAGRGFAALDDAQLPPKAVITHEGSNQRYEIALAWKDGTSVATWTIPKEAKTGEYVIDLAGGNRPALRSGNFRVEQFRVPLMRAILKPPATPAVQQDRVELTAQLSYLSGGPAGGVTVKFRSRVLPYAFSFADFDDFRFDGLTPKEGIETSTPRWLNDLEEGDEDESSAGSEAGPLAVATRTVTLDASGGATVAFDKLPIPGRNKRTPGAQSLLVEMEYADPNGQILTATTHALLLPSSLVLGMKVDGFFATRDKLSFKVLAVDVDGKPSAGRSVEVEAYSRTRYAYRKRLFGGFYAYEQTTEIKRLGRLCSGVTDPRGLLACTGPAPATGELILAAQSTDESNHAASASVEAYVGGDGEDWFEAGASDRIDLLPDRRAYEPGDTARFEVRMPFRHATALVSVEREGVLEAYVVPIDARAPYIEIPVQANYGPNVYVSALVVRGRIDPEVPGPFAWLKRMIWGIGHWLGLVDTVPKDVDTRPTALVDLTKPSYRLGIAQIRVGWKGYALNVKVESDKSVYHVRERVPVAISVTDPEGRPAANAEVAVAAVDEGLLALMPNRSWELLASMMQRRPQEVQTSTAQGQVIGKRHFGKKGVAPGGGGGSASSRELFDTLLLWEGRVALDPQGHARIEVPLNDSLTSFRIEAIAHAGEARFGSGEATVRTTQDVMLFSGVPPFVREGDAYRAMFTVRNASQRMLELDVEPSYRAIGATGPVGVPAVLAKEHVSLAPGSARTLSFRAEAPLDSARIEWSVMAREIGAGDNTSQDRLSVTQTVGAAYPVRVYQQTLIQLEPQHAQTFPVEMPRGAIAGRGGIDVRLARSLGGDFPAIREWARRYPFDCIEQKASLAVALEDRAAWDRAMAALPGYLDPDGLVRFFPVSWLQGEDSLTAYLLSVAHEAAYNIPDDSRARMLRGLADFVAGRITRWGSLPTADLAMRKLAAIDALARYGEARPQMLDSIEINPQLWPSSGVIDWISVLSRMPSIRGRDERLNEARQILRSRLTYSGTTLAFSTEKSDYLWWLMISPDRNAVRALLLATQDPTWHDDAGRMARGALARQLQGRWNTTIANAWGVLALRRFQARFEREPVNGQTLAQLGSSRATLDWSAAVSRNTGDPTQGTPIGDGPERLFAWPSPAAVLSLEHEGGGRPWAFVASRAALPLSEPLAAGYTVKRTVAGVEQKKAGEFVRGDVLRVRLEIDAQQDMTWVAVSDPIPAGATILGTGLGGDSTQLTQDEKSQGWTRPAFEERTFEAFHAYYAYVPKGHFAVEYTVRLNNAGRFEMPATRVEAMYAPEIFGETPVAAMEIAE